MKGNEDRKETDAALAAAASVIITGISALPFYEVLAKEGSLLQRLQTASTVFFMPGLFFSMVLSGNIHGGSLMVGGAINFLVYGLILYGALRWKRRRGLRMRANG